MPDKANIAQRLHFGHSDFDGKKNRHLYFSASKLRWMTVKAFPVFLDVYFDIYLLRLLSVRCIY